MFGKIYKQENKFFLLAELMLDFKERERVVSRLYYDKNL